MKFYAGIGSRSAPEDILEFMKEISEKLNKKEYILRSGGAIGADKAFESGAGTNKEIFTTKDATKSAIRIASKIHPAWYNCNDYVQKLHGRNVQIILGKDLDKPVEFVICWTFEGKNLGGTGLGINIAKKYNIPVYNLYNDRKLVENLILTDD